MANPEDLSREAWIDPRIAEAATAVAATHEALRREAAAGVPWDAGLMLTMLNSRAGQVLEYRSSAKPADADVWLARIIGSRLSREIQAIRELPENDR